MLLVEMEPWIPANGPNALSCGYAQERNGARSSAEDKLGITDLIRADWLLLAENLAQYHDCIYFLCCTLK